MKKILYNFVIINLLPLFIFAQPQTGDEHWRPNDKIKEGKYVTSCSNNGFVYACFSGDTPTSSDKYSIYKISENEIIKYLDITLTGKGGHSFISTMIFFNNELIIGGIFERVNDDLAKGCARFDGERWRGLGLGIDGMVTGCTTNGKEIYFSGLFSFVGGQPAREFVKWDGRGWTILTGINCDQVILNYKEPMYSDWYYIGQLTFIDNYIYATCTVMNPLQGYNYVSKCKNSRYYNGLVRYSILENKWEQIFPTSKPSRDIPRISMITGFLFFNNVLYISGLTSGQNVMSLFKVDNAKWQKLGTLNVGGYVESMTNTDYTLYIGGTFSSIGGENFNNIAKWDGVKWMSLGSGLTGGLKGDVEIKENPNRKPGEPLLVRNYKYSEVVKNLYGINNSIVAIGNFDKAGGISSKCVSVWNEQSSIEKSNPDSLYQKATTDYKKLNKTQALEEINKAIEINPNKPQYYLLRGEIYSDNLLKYENHDLGDYSSEIQTLVRESMNKGESDFNTAISLNPDLVEAYIGRGNLGRLSMSNPYPCKINAEEDFEMALQLDPENPRIHYYFGVYYRRAKSEKMVRCFNDAIKFTKDEHMYSDFSKYFLGEYYFKTGAYQETISYLNEFIKCNREANWYLARRYRGLSYYNLNTYDKALQDFNEILIKYPNDKTNADIYFLRGKILFKKSGNYKDACPDMKKARDLGNDDARKFVDEVCK